MSETLKLRKKVIACFESAAAYVAHPCQARSPDDMIQVALDVALTPNQGIKVRIIRSNKPMICLLIGNRRVC